MIVALCDIGYYGVGSAKCAQLEDYSRVWIDDDYYGSLQCLPKICHPLNVQYSSSILYSNSLYYGSTATLTCMDGYLGKMLFSDKRICPLATLKEPNIG